MQRTPTTETTIGDLCAVSSNALRHQHSLAEAAHREGRLSDGQYQLYDTAFRKIAMRLRRVSPADAQIRALRPRTKAGQGAFDTTAHELRTLGRTSRLAPHAELVSKYGRLDAILETVVLSYEQAFKEAEERAGQPFFIGSPDERIYLPVSKSQAQDAIKLGAKRDTSSRRGTNLYVTTDMPDAKLIAMDRFLPSDFSTRRQPFDFLEVPPSARGLNLHDVFSDADWDYIRKQLYDQCGHRCMSCGRRGGHVVETVYANEKKAHETSVHLHEEWEFDGPQEDGSYIARLTGLKVLCPTCHMMRHLEYAVARASANRMDPDAVRAKLENAIMLVNELTREELEAQKEENRKRSAELAYAQDFVLDLGYLANQSVLNNISLSLKPEDAGGVSPDLIAGISFTAHDGTVHRPVAPDAILSMRLVAQPAPPSSR